MMSLQPKVIQQAEERDIRKSLLFLTVFCLPHSQGHWHTDCYKINGNYIVSYLTTATSFLTTPHFWMKSLQKASCSRYRGRCGCQYASCKNGIIVTIWSCISVWFLSWVFSVLPPPFLTRNMSFLFMPTNGSFVLGASDSAVGCSPLLCCFSLLCAVWPVAFTSFCAPKIHYLICT